VTSCRDDADAPIDRDARNGESHLAVDLGSLTEVAAFVATAVASGLIGNAAYSLVSGFFRRHGRRRRQELEQAVYEALKRVKRKPGVSDVDLRLRVKQLLDEQG
jgi:hypothetical protein